MKATWPQRSSLIVSISPHHLEGELLLIIGDLNREVHLPRNGLTSHPHIHVVSTKAGMSYLQESKNTTAFCRNMFSKINVLIHTCFIIVCNLQYDHVEKVLFFHAPVSSICPKKNNLNIHGFFSKRYRCAPGHQYHLAAHRPCIVGGLSTEACFTHKF